MVNLQREGQRYFATIDGGRRFFVGSDVRYLSHRGLVNTSDASGTPYNPEEYRDRLLRLGEDGFTERIRPLRAAVTAGVGDSILGTRRYDAASNDFVLL